MKPLFQRKLNVINVGLQGFANNVVAAGGDVTQLSWAPPAGADAALMSEGAGFTAMYPCVASQAQKARNAQTCVLTVLVASVRCSALR